MSAVLLSLEKLVLAVFFVIGYLAPAYIAMRRGHHQLGPIAIINLLLGWTIVGWILTFAWSTSWIRPPEGSRTQG